MPEIFGIFSLKGTQITSVGDGRSDVNTLNKLKRENFAVWSDGNIGLGQQASDAEIEFSPKSSSPNKLIIAADACLTNRTELFTEFGVLPSERSDFNDNQLILKAFEKWGEDCVEHLAGDFAFAIWDNQKLFCGRDHLGGSKLFYYKDDKTFAFASTPTGIFGFKVVEKKFNKNKLAIFLLPEPHTLTSEESWFQDIYPLPAGHVLTADAGGVKIRQYWKPEPKTTLPYKSDEEILEAFRELMFEIVEAHLTRNDPVTGLLSGGLDSSAIVSVAARILEKKNKEITVFSGVLADRRDPHFSDERFFIDQFRSFPNINIKYVSAPEKGPFTDLEGFTGSYDSPVISSRHYLYTAFIEQARKIGARTILEGCFGEFGPTCYGKGGFAELFRRLKWLTLWRELKLRRDHYGESIKYNLRANTLNPLLPDFLINLKRGNNLNRLNKNHPLRADFFQALVNKTNFPENPFGRVSPDHRKNQLNDINFLYTRASDNPSATFGREPVELRHPFLDKRLIEFCLAVPLEMKMRDGFARYLVRAGLDGILPPEIQWRTSKTPFSPDYIRRYHAQIGQAKQLLNDIKPNDPLREVLDIEKIGQWVELSCRESGNYNTKYDEVAFDLVPQAVYLIYFMRRFSEFMP